MDDSQRVRQQIEIDRLSDELAREFDALPPELISEGVRREYRRRERYPVQDFVPIFVERSLRGRLRQPR
jgi:hypothetical protein